MCERRAIFFLLVNYDAEDMMKRGSDAISDSDDSGSDKESDVKRVAQAQKVAAFLRQAQPERESSRAATVAQARAVAAGLQQGQSEPEPSADVTTTVARAQTVAAGLQPAFLVRES